MNFVVLLGTKVSDDIIISKFGINLWRRLPWKLIQLGFDLQPVKVVSTFLVVHGLLN